MFILTQIEDEVKIQPQNFRNEIKTVEDEIERKYCGKVLLDVGLCVGLHDILHMGDGIVYQGEGAAQVTVIFRLIVFKPFSGEIIVGKIHHVTPDFLQVSLEFFDEITINPSLLPHPAAYDEEEKTWYWDYKGHKLFLDVGCQIRFKVESVLFNPPISATHAVKFGLEKEPNETPPNPPMQILASARESGLGMLTWW